MENPKKPTRDISDLKARLGLNKPGAVPTPAPASAPVPTPTPTSAPMPTPRPPAAAAPFPAPASPVVAPLPAPTPAPFPAAPQPAAPPPPDVREDPFGAMKSGMAPVIIQAPTFDAGPVESVRAADRTKFLRLLALSALVAVGGFWCGGINGGRKVHNNTIRDAKQIKAEVEVMAQSTQGIIDELNKSAQRAGDKPDFELVDKLEALKIDPPNTQKIFRTNYAYLDDLAVDLLFNYYNDTIQLHRAIEQHVRLTKRDKEQLEMAAKTTGGDAKYGVVFDTSGAITIAKLVELGKILCKGGAADCRAKDLEGFEFRMSPSSSWTSRSVKGPDGNRVIPIDPNTELWTNVTAGKPELLVKKAYAMRLGNIRMLAQQLFAMQKDLLAKLDAAAKKATLVAL